MIRALAAAALVAAGPASLQAIALAMPHAASPATAPVVATVDGRLAGRHAGTTDFFLGVPFAAPPTGSLRWHAPLPPAGWEGVRQAAAFGADCTQDPMQDPPGPGFVNRTSEDCLYLNIWRPHSASRAPRPVMVWIHGGAFIMGAGSFPSYDGTSFAESGVILVSFNYRLGRFGTFAHPALTREAAGGAVADYGIMDQIAALRWVKRNIAAFGGDPGNVTVFGESAGASSVNILMGSPAARGLFAKAISESGGTDSGFEHLAEAERRGSDWAQSVGVNGNDLTALRRLPARLVWGGPVMAPVFPIIDGQLITRSPDQAFASNAAPVPYMVGSNDWEQSLLRWLPGAADGLLRAHPRAGGVLDAYGQTPADRDRALRALWGDAAMTLPARERADQIVQRGGKAWLYRYAYVPTALRHTMPGAGHEAEIEMVFRTRDGRNRHVWSPEDMGMATIIHQAWVDFAITGDPNGKGVPDWSHYAPGSRPEMLFADDGAHLVHNLDGVRLDRLQVALQQGGVAAPGGMR